jgi:hypothetical protein
VKKLHHMPNERASPPLVERQALIPASSIDLDQIVIAPKARLTDRNIGAVDYTVTKRGRVPENATYRIARATKAQQKWLHQEWSVVYANGKSYADVIDELARKQQYLPDDGD